MEILRDALGVPHCYAADEAEAFYAQGWVHAADRLWQMEYDRRRAVGRMAEVVGASAVKADTFYRRLDLETYVRRDVAALAPATVAMLESYAAGVNAWLASEPLPREFDVAGLSTEDVAPWEPWHSLVVHRVRHFLMGSARTKLWRSVVAEAIGDDVARSMVAGWGEEQIACVPPGAECRDGITTGLGDGEGGSNNWVLAGARTASGHPLLAGDPHRELEAPNVYVQGHVSCPEWDVLGIGMPGVPGFPHFGHNERVAWSITHGMADDQDLFEFAPGSLPVTRTEVVSVRGGERVEVDVVHSPRGPLVAPDLALCWTALADEPNVGFDTFPVMLRARDVAELFESMRPWVEPVNSLLAADVDGSIGFQLRGRLPRRRGSGDAVWTPVPGDDDALAWDGWVPFDELPRALDPSDGFLFSANNRIAAAAGAPYVGMDAAAPWRARRIVSLLSAMEEATVDDMALVHTDDVSLPARRVKDRLGAWPPIADWDGSMSSLSRPAAAYSVLRRELLLVVLERSGLGDVLSHPRNRLLPGVVPESLLWRVVEQHLRDEDTSLLGGWSWDEAIAVARLRADEIWRGESWGALHRTGQRHVLGGLDPTLHPATRVEVSGDQDTVLASAYTPTAGFDVKAGPVARYAFDLSDWDRSQWVVPLGAAGAPPSPHAADQQEAWAAGRLFPAPYSRAAVEASAAAAVTRDG